MTALVLYGGPTSGAAEIAAELIRAQFEPTRYFHAATPADLLTVTNFYDVAVFHAAHPDDVADVLRLFPGIPPVMLEISSPGETSPRPPRSMERIDTTHRTLASAAHAVRTAVYLHRSHLADDIW